MTFVYDLYGMVIASDVDLHQDRPAPASAGVDLTIERAPRVREQTPLDGKSILDHSRDGRRWYHAVRREDGSYTLRFTDMCDFDVSADLRRATVFAAPTDERGVATVLTSGALLAFVLHLRGDFVLHGSAVVHDGDDADPLTVGFVGRSGMGKSTMASLLCRAGGSLITDDVLVLDRASEGFVPRWGASDVRLREGAASLAEDFAASQRTERTSPDGRRVVRLAGSADAVTEPPPLRAIMIPFPDRERDEIAIERLTAKDAALLLMRFPRLSEWSEPEGVARHFSSLAALTSCVPVAIVRVPWGPPFAESVADAILDEVRTAAALR